MTNSPGESLSFKSVLPWIVLVLVLSVLPYAAAWLSTPPDKEFVGALVNPDDFPTYLSAMRQGANGSWLFHFTYSPEPWQPRIMMIPYLLLGKATGILGGSFTAWYHAARLIFGFFTLSMVLVWVRTVFPGRRQLQFTGWFLIVFGAGLGWIAAMASGPSASIFAPDLFGPEWTTFMALLHTPHFALGLGFELLFFACVIKMIQQERWSWALAGAAVGIALGQVYVYHIAVAGLVVGAALIAAAWQQKRNSLKMLAMGAVVLLPLVVMLIYYTAVANQDPFFAAYARYDHVIPPPKWYGALIGFGVLGVLAMAGIRSWFGGKFTWLVPIWIGANLVLLYLPVIKYSGRFALGLLAPMATMAALGLEEKVLPWISKRPFYSRFSRLTPTPYASLRRVLLFLVLPSTFILPFWLGWGAIQAVDFPTYLPKAEMEAMDWLADTVDESELIFSYYPVGNYLPAVSAAKVFVGQLDFTTDLEAKLDAVNQFWLSGTSDAWRRQLVDQWGIDYVYLGRYELALMDGDVQPPGELNYDRDGVKIFAIREK